MSSTAPLDLDRRRPRAAFGLDTSLARRELTEDAIQSSIVSWLRLVLPGALIYAHANGARRTDHGRAANAVPGLMSGLPDLGIILPGGRLLCIEVKRQGEHRSKAQEHIATQLDRLGVPHCVATRIEEVRAFLREAGVKTREARAP